MKLEGNGAQATYDVWLGFISQVLGQLGGVAEGGKVKTPLIFPADQVARAGVMMQEALQRFTQTASPTLQAAGPSGLLGHWAAAPHMQLGPMLQVAKDLAGEAPQTYATALARTFGGLQDALGLGPGRNLQEVMQEVLRAGVAQNDARATYIELVTNAFVSGFEDLLVRLARKAEDGERVDSIVALLRLWTQCTDDHVHRVLQSEPGLAATAALTRAGVATRKKIQRAAGIVAAELDMATRSELDDAFREIQQLKREVRSLRKALPASPPPPRAERHHGRRRGPAP